MSSKLKHYKETNCQLLVTKNKVALIATPFQMKVLKRALVKQNKHPEPETRGTFKKFAEEVKQLSGDAKIKGQTLELFHLLRNLPYKD